MVLPQAFPKRLASRRGSSSACLACAARFAITSVWVVLLSWGTAHALPRVPVPPENPTTEPKRVLGKILFWDEQLSSDNTVACGTCHRPASGGADPRAAVHPGTDPGTIDDVMGSPGIASFDIDGRPKRHALFGEAAQVTRRLSPSIYGALWASELFWDGRAGGEFRDPLTGDVAIAAGGALESQVLETLDNEVEMTAPARPWRKLAAKLERSRPLALAADVPGDAAAAIATHGGYPALFHAAFGDRAITPVRIAFAIATYERTLVADQTAWDRYAAGETSALTRAELFGWQAMQDFHCVKCHEPPKFTNDSFVNIGLRRSEYDLGRQAVTGDPEDAGEVRVPSLRNAGLRPRFMHTGEFASLGAAIDFYRTGPALPDRDGIPGAGIYSFNMGQLTVADIRTFIATALTDPRVANEEYPFDRPTLRTERHQDDRSAPEPPAMLEAAVENGEVALQWQRARDDTGVVDYLVLRNGAVVALVTQPFARDAAPRSAEVEYGVIARDAAGNESAAAQTQIKLGVTRGK